MTRAELIQQIHAKQSFLCVGLDTDLDKIPAHLLDFEDPIYEFNRAIVEATSPFTIAYKPNIAFYERLGSKGWDTLKKTLEIIPDHCFTIADAKRGDIGNTSKYYADTFFKYMDFDSVTVAPYMGEDSVTPFLEYDNKWVIVLGVTSNKGALDFQMLPVEGRPLFHHVIERSSSWGTANNMMFVAGATRGELLAQVREIVPDHFFLVPGVGAQGGSLEEVVRFGKNADVGLLVNSSRGIIYADKGLDFARHAAIEAERLQSDMKSALNELNFRP
ncbi:MAG: orotidine-5'-phosphate decarboxylase [Flavobacteriales bacterium]|nr:orotidine-5'-phosphate decarboxylase [Flavobacteriales bacterium]